MMAKTDGNEGVQGGRLVLALLVLEIDETSGDEIDGEVVGGTNRRRHKEDDGHDPVEEEGSSRGI